MLEEKKLNIATLENTIATNTTTISNLETDNARLTAKAQEAAQTIATNNATISELQEDIALKTNELESANATINSQYFGTEILFGDA